MKINWPPDKDRQFVYEAEYPTLENGIVINTVPGGKSKHRTEHDNR